ncbi:MAG TPA: FAD-binding oxidoreductase [Gemmatimonadales bacterium]|nr:FAD-binding oxidoreductase [Gemmatimonadales bacterium]
MRAEGGPDAERCLWTDAAPELTVPEASLPQRTDVAIVGGGYTGLAAARALARRGVDVTLLEQHHLGWGASGRNGGFVLPGYKPDIEVLARKHGLAAARRLFEISLEAVRMLESVIAEEAIDCDYTRCGSLVLAAKPSHLRGLEASRRFLEAELGHETALLGPTEIGAEIGSARYHGGLLDHGAGALHPVRYLRGLATSVIRSGARIVQGVEVRQVTGSAKHLTLDTSDGVLLAAEMLVATNGYTGALCPALQRRVIPIGSYLIATARLDPSLGGRLIPKGRVLSDTKNLLYYFRLSSDGRMVFGGRAAFTPAPVARSAAILERGMREVFPELAGVPVEYAWGGKVGFTLDQLPHAGRLGPVHYALGYCGHGVALSTWLGTRLGEALAGGGELPVLGPGRFRSVPLYAGRPWFLPLVGAWYRAADWLS